MIYKPFAQMRKLYDFSYVDKKARYMVFSAPVAGIIGNSKELEALQGGFPSRMMESLVNGKTASCLALHPESWDLGHFEFSTPDGRKYCFDFECDRVTVWKENGKPDYKIYVVKAIRLCSFAPDYTPFTLPDYTNTFGSWSNNSGLYIDKTLSA